MDVLERILEKKIIAIIRGLKLEETLKTADAAAAGGLSLVEVPFDQRQPLAYTTDKIKAVADRYPDGRVLVGAGTVLTIQQVQAAKAAGAGYIITPTSREDVIKETKALGMVAMPGAMTPSEIEQCYRWGADIVKVFPSDNLGAGYIKALQGPLSYIPMAAVGGVDLDNILDFFDAGVCAVGIGGNIVNRKMIETGDYKGIENLAAAYTAKIR
ncbi:bifunctional 4-hydroxy-2-oxoglutarate aldolase/2-dehydro-3-deoxy-phosphogluconate aldolase [Lachnoclostridium pacaense]|uniref:bifunctional 4-hydroxy-2-oxoglutarate aldolase/2-dehydro-3-deoxy-phosphogluconate aldolase n=1 Tax=Enterocloster hominis (ex Hitch et al. 2024) TaxID=1917870 RepID=UPI001D12B9C6|nr:bifunctional 4-hydroxy-2-oxoglutarate aldolase/2-dehydro-3-deoxy-phosphogluconate aldolase [Lachnoclostridium pacaense]MCC2819165.1 bifunctional 4-hydroxy-2-oxoglutarate aldolase/2-dehydro-3-deoxy-phosphogluconate aldolase [Lachnoclostridium pacaense]MCC2875962.1 bifunctional 4-hydroxy-2-oxoglutarate aldolase/2-dehydro-3-deoxy-phosphogluconate aldolase [Lachnoclostridium pacaense]